MVQSYGIIPAKGSANPGTTEVGEQAVLLGRGSLVNGTEKDGHASLISCISNLANTIMGTGMLTFPLAVASCGLIPGIFSCIFSGSVSAFALYLLSLCATYAPHRQASFFSISQMTFPSAAIFFDAAIAIKCFGVSISYLIIIKGLMPNVVESFYHVLTSPTTLPPPWTLNGGNWVVIFSVALVPLAYLRRLDSLRHTSYVALFAVAYLLVIVIRCHFWPMQGMPSRGPVHLIHFTPNFISTFPVQVFAFTCAQNLFPLYNELKGNTQVRMNLIIGSAIGSATITYEIIAVIGYLTFGSKVGSNIIAMYPSTSIFIACGQLAIVILVMFSYPLQVHPCRNCLDKVVVFGHNERYKPISENEDVNDLSSDADHAAAEMSPCKHAVLTSAIVVTGFAIAYFVDDLQTVLSFVGSTGSTTISFILPGLLYWKLTRGDLSKRALNRAALALASYGGLIFTFCFGFNVYQVVYGATANRHGH